jgi:hypothetical protein
LELLDLLLEVEQVVIVVYLAKLAGRHRLEQSYACSSKALRIWLRTAPEPGQ